MRRIAVACLLLLPLTARAAANEPPEAAPVDGAAFRADLAGVDADGNVRFAAGAARSSIKLADLAHWGSFADATAGPQIVLAGGGTIVADVLAIEGEQLRAESDALGAIKLPLEALAGIVLRPPSDAARRDQLLAEVESATGDHDRLLLDNGDRLTGSLTALREGTVTIQADGGKVDVELARVAAIVFNPSLAAKPRREQLRALVGLADGTRLPAAQLAADDRKASIKLLGATDLALGTAQIRAILPLAGRAVYLSDRKPAGYRHVPYLQLTWPYEADRNVLGGKLRAFGAVYPKGLGMHSAARLTYDLDQPYARFQAQLAIDDRAEGRGSAVFRVYTDDGSGRWQPKYTSPTVRGGEKPVPVDVDLSGAKRISLLVEFADRGDELDYANWLFARLVKP